MSGEYILELYNLKKYFRAIKLFFYITKKIDEVKTLRNFQLDKLHSKELFKDVIVNLINGNELTLNFFELKNESVIIPVHNHPVEHLVIILHGEIEFVFIKKTLLLKEGEGLFLPAGQHHSAYVVRAPVKAFEIYKKTKDKYYEPIKKLEKKLRFFISL
jgi:quercetin dioxygenase-like cupin family protein